MLITLLRPTLISALKVIYFNRKKSATEKVVFVCEQWTVVKHAYPFSIGEDVA